MCVWNGHRNTEGKMPDFNCWHDLLTERGKKYVLEIGHFNSHYFCELSFCMFWKTLYTIITEQKHNNATMASNKPKACTLWTWWGTNWTFSNLALSVFVVFQYNTSQQSHWADWLKNMIVQKIISRISY